MNWIGEFAQGLADGMFWPLLFASMIAAVVAVISFNEREDRMKPHTPEHQSATWRIWACVQGVIVGWLAWALLAAVPEPDYIYRDRVKVVEKVVKVPVEKRVNVVREVKVPVPTNRVITKTVTRVLPLARDLRYIKLFETCMGKGVTRGGWAVDDVPETASSYAKGASQVRNERIELCHDNAREVLR